MTIQIGSSGNPIYEASDSNDAASFAAATSASIQLVAPDTYADRQFIKWQWAGQDLSTTSTITVISSQLTGNGPLTAIYQPLPPPSAGFTPNFTRANFPHWSHFPVNVYLDSTVVVGSSNQTSIVNGMNRWVSASGGLVSYQLVTNPAQADITVGFGSTPSGLVALTTATWDGNYNLTQASVALNPPVLPANETSTQNLDTIMAHEFGHSLGLIADGDLTAGHSTDPHDTMYASGNSAIGLITERDINTIATNYTTLFAGDASGKSLQTSAGRTRRAAIVGPMHHASIF